MHGPNLLYLNPRSFALGKSHEAARFHYAGPYSRSGARNWACRSARARSDLAAADRSCDSTAPARHRDGHSRARLFAQRLAERWGQPVIVENRQGRGAIPAVMSFLAAPD